MLCAAGSPNLWLSFRFHLFWTVDCMQLNCSCNCYTVASSFTHKYFIGFISNASLLSRAIQLDWFHVKSNVHSINLNTHSSHVAIQNPNQCIFGLGNFLQRIIAIWSMICNPNFDYKEFQSRLTMWIVPALHLLSYQSNHSWTTNEKKTAPLFKIIESKSK